MIADDPPADDPRFADAPISIDAERAKRQKEPGPGSGWEAELVYDRKGRGDAVEITIAPTAGNLALLLRNEPAWAGSLGYNEFAEREVWLKSPPKLKGLTPPAAGEVKDEHDTYVQHWWHCNRKLLVPGVTTAVMATARANSFHPVRRYLEQLTWDGTQRIPTWLSTYFSVADSPYAREVGTMWMVSAVARVMRPGEKVDTMLILEGEQGKGKSSGLAALVPEADWYSDTPIDLRHKQDAFQVLQGKWIYEIGELQSFRGQDATRIKNFLSASSDNYRASYGKRNRTYPRHCVFAGTTNEEHYLTDRSGNRRFWPVRCGAVNVAAIRRDRDQLWAEALVRFTDGAAWHITDAAIAQLTQEQQESRLVADDPWAELVIKWLEAPTVPTEGSQTERTVIDLAKGFTTTDVLLGALSLRRENLDRLRASRVGVILGELGYSPQQHWLDGRTKKVRLYFKTSSDTT